MRVTKATSTLRSKWNSSSDRECSQRGAATNSQWCGRLNRPQAGGYSMYEIVYQCYFFGFWIFSVCFTTNDFTRANSFLEPFTKSRGPYSNKTTKAKARTINKTSQKSPRSNAMIDRVTRSKERVNASARVFDKLAAASLSRGGRDACRLGQTGSPSSLNRRPKLPCFSRHARAAARS